MMMKCKLKWVADKKGGEGVQCLETYSFQCLYLGIRERAVNSLTVLQTEKAVNSLTVLQTERAVNSLTVLQRESS
jgi:hypothetical protein